jgi:hypothetical protein
MEVQGQPRQIVCETPIFKITRAKWAGGMCQAVEHLFWKHEALSSNPSPAPHPPLQKIKISDGTLLALD